ncbi:MAG: antibiotic biosynthesis monooxygenase [Frankiales bacterium]|nr:antibiotic biosynthesis monooxygenase [Frankiales bacterium]
MLVVIATLNGKPERRADITAALAKAAAASRGDAGCLSYSFTVDVEDPDRFISVETWEDKASLDAHFTQPHLAELFGVLGDALEGPADIKTYETSGPLA